MRVQLRTAFRKNAPYQVLGNSLAVAMAKYIKPSVKDSPAGSGLLEAARQSTESK